MTTTQPPPPSSTPRSTTATTTSNDSNNNNNNIIISSTPIPPTTLLTKLTAHLPHSLPVLRRLQFTLNFPGGRSPHTRVVYARYGRRGCGGSDDEDGKSSCKVDGEGQGGDDGKEMKEDGDGNGKEEEGEVETDHFAVACVDLSRAPETQVWVYASLEDGVNVRFSAEEQQQQQQLLLKGGQGGEREGEGVGRGMELVMAVLRGVRAIAAAAAADGGHGAAGGSGSGTEVKAESSSPCMKVLVGSLHEAVRRGLLARGVKMEKTAGVAQELEWEFCGKWLFRVEDLPGADDEPLPEGMQWDRVRKGDVGIVRERTSINRQEATLLMLPSTVVRLDDGTPVAWGFMGLDGTAMTVHVEAPYRRSGLGKLLVSKLMREHLPDYGEDGWGATDVFVENHKSQAMCRSLGGKLSWTLSWAILDLESVGSPM